MTAKQKVRMSIDIFMTLISLVLMGGTLFFSESVIHEILGMALLCLWCVHIVFNYRWYTSIFKGTYSAYRIMQIIVNLGIGICAVFLTFSGIMMSRFTNISFGQDFARTVHLLSSHWYFLFMNAHLGMHLGMIFSSIKKKRSGIFSLIVLFIVCAYGIYAFIIRGIGKYLFLRQQFFFLDLQRGYFLYFVDYISIMVLIATISYYLAKFLSKKGKY